MKFKYLLIIGLMLIILSISAVSASQDMDNLTVDANNQHIVDNQTDSLEQSHDSESLNDNNLITNYSYEIDVSDTYLKDDYSYVKGWLPDNASGEVLISIDEYNHTCVVDSGYFSYNFTNLNLSCGAHNILLNYTGDASYGGFTYEKTFRVDKLLINIPDEVIYDKYDDGWDEYWIRVVNNISGNITVWIDENKIIDNVISDIVCYDYLNYTYRYYIPINKTLNKSFSLGLHTYNITYNGDYLLSKTGSFNASDKTIHLIDPAFTITINDTEESYPVNVTVRAVSEFTGDVIVKINTNHVLVHIENGFGFNLTNLDLTPSNYLATLDFNQTSEFSSAHAETTFNVTFKPADANLKINISDIDLGGNLTVYISINKNATKNVFINVFSQNSAVYNKTFEVNITDGCGNLTISDLNTSGKYRITAGYDGDGKVSPDKINSTFKVLEDINLDAILPNSIYENEALLVNLSINPARPGDAIEIKIKFSPNSTAPAMVVFESGISKKTADISGLSANNYILNFIFGGNDYYRPCNLTRALQVKKVFLNPELNVEPIEDVFKGSLGSIKFTIHKNATGKVMVKIGSNEYLINLSGLDFYTVDIPTYLSIGSYVVNVSYAGGKNSANLPDEGNYYDFRGDYKILSFRVKPIPVSANMNVSSNNIYEGQNATINVEINPYVTGNVEITVNGKKEKINITSGIGKYTIPDLVPGNYTYTVSFEGDDYFLNDTKTVSFKVFEKINPNLNATVSDVYVGQNAVVNVEINSTVTGDVCINVGGIDKKINIINGKGSFTLTSLEVGNYTFNVSFKGDIKFTSQIKTVSFKVMEKLNSQLKLRAEDVYVGGNVELNIKINENITGRVSINIDGRDTEINIVNGRGNYTFRNLKAGDYNYNVSYSGDYRFKSEVKLLSFKVKLNPITFTLTIDDVLEDNPIIIQVRANETVTGNVSIKIAENNFLVALMNGEGSINTNLTLPVNTYTATLVFTGNDIYNATGCEKNFNVVAKQIFLDPKLTISVANVIVDDSVEIIITTNNTISATVNVKINDIDVNVTVTDGFGKTSIGNLPVGEYTAVATFKGGLIFQTSTKSATFSVIPFDPKLTISVADVIVDESVDIIITANTTLSGIVNVKIGDVSVDVSITNGFGRTSVDGLGAGQYTAVATFNASGKFATSTKSATFRVIPLDAKLTISVTNINVGEGAVILITTNTTYSGIVNVKIENNSVDVSVRNGVGRGTVYGLVSGNYTAVATLKASGKFATSIKNATFRVYPIDPSLTISVEDFNVGQAAVVVITTNTTYSGIVNVKIANVTVDITVTNGRGSSNVWGFVSGDYIAVATFNADSRFITSLKSDTFTVYPIDPSLTISVESIDIGDDAVVLVTTNNTFSGIVEVKIGALNIDVEVISGIGNFSVKNLALGNYTAVATFNPDSRFIASSKNTTFDVHLANPQLNIGVSNITIVENENIIITAKNTFTGIVHLKIANKTFDVNLTAGKGNITIKNLALGTYTAVATIDESDMFEASCKNATFSVVLVNPDLNISVDDVIIGNDAIILVTTNKTFYGVVNVKVAGINLNIIVVNGKGNSTIEGLSLGNYTAVATFAETKIFAGSIKSVDFKVKKEVIPPVVVLLDPQLTVTSPSITEGATAVVTITTNTTFTGNVTLQLNSNTYIVEVIEGKASMSIPGLPIGTYTATVIFNKTEIFNESQKSVTFKVNKKADVIKLTLKKVKVKKSSRKLTLSATLKINGKAVKGRKITFKFAKKTYHAKTNKKGIAKVTVKKNVLRKLKKGKKVTYSAKYSTKTVKRTAKVRK